MSGIVKREGGWWLVPLLSLATLGAGSGDRRLMEATKAGDAATIRALIEDRVDVNVSEPDGATALHWASHRDDLEMADLLIRAGARVNAVNDYGIAPLNLACTNGSAAMVEKLLKAGANLHAVPSTGETPLMTAARTGKVDVVNVLLAHGADVNAKEPSGQTALMWAVGEEHLDIARILIARGADVRARSTGGFTPLLFGARQGSIDAARILLAVGANVNETAADGSSPLLVATVRGHVPLAVFLLNQGADPNADGAGYTALHWTVASQESEFVGDFGIAAESGEWSALSGLQGAAELELLNALLAHGANPNARLRKELPHWGHSNGSVKWFNLAGATPFLLAAKAGHVSAMRVLLAAGADPGLTTDDNTPPLIVAAGYGRIIGMSLVTEKSALEAVRLALEMGADVNTANNIGETALHGAAYQGWDTIVQLLVDTGAKVNVKNKAERGYTPLAIAEGTVYHSAGPQYHPSTGTLLRKLGAVSQE